jgi:hypothetical protein
MASGAEGSAPVRIVVERSRTGADDTETAELVATLTEHGFAPQVRARGEDTGYLAPFGQDLVLHLLEHGSEEMISALVGALTASLSRWRRKSKEPPKRVVILGPNGDPLRVVEVPPRSDG